MKCPDCGSELENGRKFCSKCGHKIQPAQKPASSQPIRKATNSKTWRPFIYIIVSAIIFYAAAIIYTSYKVQSDIKYSQMMLETGKTSVCIQRLQKVTQKRPRLSSAWTTLAECYGENDQAEKAIETLNDSMKWCKPGDKTYSLLGMMYYRNENQDKAEENLNKAIEINPNNRIAGHYLGLLLKQKGEYDRALELLELAKNEAARVERIEINTNIGEIYFERKQFEDAEKYFLSALEENLNDVYVASKLIECYIATDNFKEARQEVDRVIEIAPDDERIAKLKKNVYRFSEQMEIIDYVINRRECDRNFMIVFSGLQSFIDRMNINPNAFMGKNIPELDMMQSDAEIITECYKNLKPTNELYYIVHTQTISTSGYLTSSINSLKQYIRTSNSGDGQALEMEFRNLKKLVEEMLAKWDREDKEINIEELMKKAEITKETIRLEREQAEAIKKDKSDSFRVPESGPSETPLTDQPEEDATGEQPLQEPDI